MASPTMPMTTMATITSAQPSSTQHHIPPLTTLVRPLNYACESLYRTATLSNTKPTLLITSDTAHSLFSSCQPSGWDESNFTFSPGVCPSYWTYWNMATTTSDATRMMQAFCCSRYFSLTSTNSGHSCIYTYGTYIHTSDDETAWVTRLHQPWVVQWQATDRLPVSLPVFTNATTLTTFDPFDRASMNGDEGGNHDSVGILVGTLMLIVVLPVIIVALTVTACVILCRRKRRKARLRLQEQEAQQAAQQEQQLSETSQSVEEVKPINFKEEK
ncbi:hypothetical protein VHEMI01598 [[Torrubiella] hemipterigena]|uniref:Uncharacterized protein n=1 Tax=[Torrubiella] hemipterigena TaxID=1531966 RepID=A0A0A1STH8_9HYPO|nr:hypothetical protein VHEMI01598 [[Torrubiella] hemipterigena]